MKEPICMKFKYLLLVFVAFSLSCTSKDQLKKTLEENPEILTNVIDKHPKLFLDTLNKAVEKAKSEAREGQAKAQTQAMEDEFNNPKVPVIEDGRVIFGSKNAPVTIVEYSDFECPFCTRGYKVVNEIKKAYGDKVRVIYKHLPLSFHPMAEPAARYYEAIALQNHKKAEKFHDLIFEDQGGLKSGKEKFLDKMAKKAGANLKRVKKDLQSEKVSKVIEADMAEAQKYGFSGTPGFLVNGVSVKGAFPFGHFKKIIDRHLKK